MRLAAEFGRYRVWFGRLRSRRRTNPASIPPGGLVRSDSPPSNRPAGGDSRFRFSFCDPGVPRRFDLRRRIDRSNVVRSIARARPITLIAGRSVTFERSTVRYPGRRSRSDGWCRSDDTGRTMSADRTILVGRCRPIVRCRSPTVSVSYDPTLIRGRRGVSDARPGLVGSRRIIERPSHRPPPGGGGEIATTRRDRTGRGVSEPDHANPVRPSRPRGSRRSFARPPGRDAFYRRAD